MSAEWALYGGNSPVQPEQNLMALDILGNMSIMDVSPMMLARADATFDGVHFCLPGPIDSWSHMLYYRIHLEHENSSLS